MRITSVYTRTGDKGTTRLVGGQELAKNHPRVEVYGSVDELNAVLGLVRAFNGAFSGPGHPADGGEAPGGVSQRQAAARVEGILRNVQNHLFVLGSVLATLPEDRWAEMDRIADHHVRLLERYIDSLNADLPQLEEFILPGGGRVSATLHQARTVCRRVERRWVALQAEQAEPDEQPGRYLNRLADLLFVLARWAARAHGEPELHWERPPGDQP